MAWGTPTSRGTAADTDAPTSLPITGVSVAQNSLILVAGGVGINAPTVAVTDSAGNTYTVIQITDTGPTPDITAFLAYAVATNALESGTVTVAWGGGTASSALGEVFEVTGGATSNVNDADVTVAANEAATTTPSTTSGTPVNAGELFVAVDITQSATTTWTEDTGNGWSTARGKDLTIVGQGMALAVSYQVNAGTDPKTWAPTTANQAHGKVITGFKLPAASPANFAAAQTLAGVSQSATFKAGSNFSAAQTLQGVTSQVATIVQHRRLLGDIETAFVKSYGGEVNEGAPLGKFDLPAYFAEQRRLRREAEEEARRRWPVWHEPAKPRTRIR